MIKQYLYRLIFLQIRFDVDIDLRSFPESGFERFFHLCGDIVRFDDRRIGVDFDVHVDDECVSVFTRAQVVECDDSGSRQYFVPLLRGGTFREVLVCWGERAYKRLQR